MHVFQVYRLSLEMLTGLSFTLLISRFSVGAWLIVIVTMTVKRYCLHSFLFFLVLGRQEVTDLHNMTHLLQWRRKILLHPPRFPVSVYCCLLGVYWCVVLGGAANKCDASSLCGRRFVCILNRRSQSNQWHLPVFFLPAHLCGLLLPPCLLAVSHGSGDAV